MLSFTAYEEHDPDLCACGCKTPVAYNGLEPRFASGACRTRWVDKWAIKPCEPEPVALDDGPQEPPPAEPDAVPVEEVAETQAEFARRIAVAPQVEVALQAAPTGIEVRPRARSLWHLIGKRGKVR